MPKRENPFKPAQESALWIKAYLFGGTGSGKTYFGLNAPGPVAVIDTEGGTTFFKGMVPDFDVQLTKSMADVEAALDYLDVEPGAYGTLVIDPVTVLYETLQDAALKARIAKKARQGGSGFDPDLVDLEILDWTKIKRRFKNLMTRLANAKCHVIVTAREKDDTVMRGGELVKLGVKDDSQKGTAYYFDVVLHTETKGETRVFTVMKARGIIGQTLPLGSSYVNPTFDSLFGPVLKGEKPKAGKPAPAKAERVVPSDEAASAKDAAAFGEKIASPELVEEFVKVMDSLGFDAEIVRQRRNWPPFSEMPESVLTEALAKLKGPEKPPAAPPAARTTRGRRPAAPQADEEAAQGGETDPDANEDPDEGLNRGDNYLEATAAEDAMGGYPIPQ